MSAAVRYYSRSGNTKTLAEAIAGTARVPAVSVDAKDAEIKDPVDVLFIGGALYAYGIDVHLKDYLKTLDKSKVKKAVVFSSTWISRHSIALIREGLKEQGIDVAEEALYVRGKPGTEQLKQAEAFAGKFL